MGFGVIIVSQLMNIFRLYLHNFRNYSDVLFEFEPGLNLVVGPNGVGKTNLLEGIAYLSVPRSFRGVKDSGLIRWGETGFDIKGIVENGFTRHTLEVHYYEGKKNYLIDEKRVDSFAEIFDTFITLVVTAKDQEIVDGPPEARRKNIDYFGSFFDPAYYQLLMSYKKALKEKNALLKKNPIMEHVIPWNLKLYEIGERLVASRERFLKMIENILNVRLRELGLDGSVSFSYEPSLDGFKNYTREDFEEEKRNGFSLVGPHRDKITINFQGYPAAAAASEGQKRLILIGLFLTEREIIGDRLGELPVLILDEPMSVLGDELISRVVSHLSGQVIISSVRKIEGFHVIELNQTVSGRV